MERIVLTEGQFYSEPIPLLAQRLGIDKYSLVNGLYAADEYMSCRLAVSNTLRIDRERFAFVRIAGVFRINDCLEIEVVPKFLTGAETWRADFLLLLAHTRWGMFAEERMVDVATNQDRGINDTLAMVFLAMFDKVCHVPIRTYQRRTVRDFQIVGDLDEETVVMPELDGFAQEVTEFSRSNDFNSVISHAAQILMKSAVDFSLRSRLQRVIAFLGPQDDLAPYRPKTVPSRFGNWSELYSLSVDLLDGYGIDYLSKGDLQSPGFVVRTADAWEEFIRQALVLGMKGCTVAFQEKHRFAKRDHSMVQVRPDYVIRSVDGREILVDAKYKYSDAKAKTVSNADIYEGWAFMEATGIARLLLLYPYAHEDMVGRFERFQSVTDDKKQIVGIRVNPQSYGTIGFAALASELGSCIDPYMLTSGGRYSRRVDSLRCVNPSAKPACDTPVLWTARFQGAGVFSVSPA